MLKTINLIFNKFSMKQIILFLIFTFSISISAQQMYWYDVILEVEGKYTNAFEKTVDNYYSSKDFPSDVTMTFSRIPLKGQGFEGTHILSFVSPSSQSLADLRASLSGDKWENYLELVRPYVKTVRSVAGNVLEVYNSEDFYSIGQAWVFKIKGKNIPTFIGAFKDLMKTFDFPGFVGLAQVTHGNSNGENIIIYGTYDSLNSAFTFGPKGKKEENAFSDFYEVTSDIADFTQSWTRVGIKTYN